MTTDNLSRTLTDDELMLLVQAGEDRAFERLVERHQGPLWGFFFRNVRDAQLAEDLTQETLLKLYNQAWDYLPRGKFRAKFRAGLREPCAGLCGPCAGLAQPPVTLRCVAQPR